MFKKYQNTLRRVFIPAVLLGLLAWLGFHVGFSQNGFWHLHQLEVENQQLRHQLDSLSLEVEKVRVEIERLQSDTFYIESVARTRYGYTKKGEQSYIIQSAEEHED